VGQLARARRWDYTQIPATEPVYPALPTAAPDRELRYRYGAGGLRVLKSKVAADGTQQHTADVFETLRLEGAGYVEGSGSYERTGATEVVLIPGIGRVVHRPGLPRGGNSDRHVLLELGDHLGSTITVVDHGTGELVERTTYQPYGAVESDYRPSRWSALHEAHQFTAKEQDSEVGAIYFGARYYQPHLGRWISADPLTIHGLGSDLNPYAYVGGRVTTQVDQLGLQGEIILRLDPPPIVSQPRTQEDPPVIEVTVRGLPRLPPNMPSALGVDHSPTRPDRPPPTPIWEGAMAMLINASPVALGLAMLLDPDRTISTLLTQRIESLIGPTNTASDASYTPARIRGSTGQPAVSDTDALLSITAQKIVAAGVGKGLSVATTSLAGGLPLIPWRPRTPTRGWLDTGRAYIELWSGESGGPPALPMPGRNNANFWHVEAHAAQTMRVEGISEATLQITKVPCTVSPGCANMLPHMLPEGSQLRVIGPGGYDVTFRGLPDPPNYPR